MCHFLDKLSIVFEDHIMRSRVLLHRQLQINMLIKVNKELLIYNKLQQIPEAACRYLIGLQYKETGMTYNQNKTADEHSPTNNLE